MIGLFCRILSLLWVLLQKSPTFFSILLTKASPYKDMHIYISCLLTCMCITWMYVQFALINARGNMRPFKHKRKCMTLQHTASHCITLQHTATHCNTLQHPKQINDQRHHAAYQHGHTAMNHTATYTATNCNTLQHTATHCNALQHTATHCNTLQHTATPQTTQ